MQSNTRNPNSVSPAKKETTESGLDDFGARYYASNMGRWMSPDWAAKEEPVPYAKLDDPQSLNLYAYLGNDPLGSTDPDGHAGAGVIGCSGPKCAPRSQREGTPTEKMVAGGLALGIGALLGVDEIAAAARGAWAIGTALLLSHPEAVQQANEMLQDAAAPPGAPSLSTGAAASSLGFAAGKFETIGTNTIAGELQGGGQAIISVAQNGSNLGVGISVVANGSAGTLSRLEAGAMDLAKAQGASSLTLTGKMASAAMGRLLGQNGFTQVVKDGVKTNNWTKTIQIK